MSLTLRARRIVTDHDRQGRAVIASDEIRADAVSARPGHERLDLWKAADGTVFRLVRYEPGVAPRNHRTETVDYAVVLSGEIDMDVDGAVVRLRAGDVLIQQNTMHNWVNRGTQACVIAFVLVPAKGARGAVG